MLRLVLEALDNAATASWSFWLFIYIPMTLKLIETMPLFM